MADKLVPYIKASDGSLLPVVALYDEEGNEIPSTYLKIKDVGSIRIYYDADGYPCYEDR